MMYFIKYPIMESHGIPSMESHDSYLSRILEFKNCLTAAGRTADSSRQQFLAGRNPGILL
jgi:hypothetical protein